MVWLIRQTIWGKPDPCIWRGSFWGAFLISANWLNQDICTDLDHGYSRGLGKNFGHFSSRRTVERGVTAQQLPCVENHELVALLLMVLQVHLDGQLLPNGWLLSMELYGEEFAQNRPMAALVRLLGTVTAQWASDTFQFYLCVFVSIDEKLFPPNINYSYTRLSSSRLSTNGTVQSQVSQKRTPLAHLFLKNSVKSSSLNTGYRVGPTIDCSLFIILSPQSEPDLFFATLYAARK